MRNLLAGLLPTTSDELQGWQVASMLVFAAIATFLANRRKPAGQKVDFHYIARNAAAGLTFPVSLVLVFYPVLPQVQALFAAANLGIYLSLAGALGAMLTFYSLIK
jgi:hypothetical protein